MVEQGNLVFAATAAGALLLVCLGRWLVLRRRRRAVRARLAGLLPPEQMDVWSRNPEPHLEPSGKVLTVMFVHVVGFAIVAQKRSPEEAFRWLRRLLGELADEVHQHGGIVDATLGDGILACFGYRSSSEPAARNHGDCAVRCATQMQINNAKRMMGAGERHEPVLPLRIGLNTAPVYLGNVGVGERVDLTFIGHGVNVAKRYESVCENNCILMGRSTRDILTEVGDRDVNFRLRHIPVKHGEDLQKVWEARPLWRHPSMAERANAAFREFVEPDRAEERWGVPDGVSLKVISSLGEGEVENFSFSGLGVRFSSFLGKDTTLSLQLVGPDELWNERLVRAGLSPLGAEVRWGAPSEQGYRLGLRLHALSPAQRQQLILFLRQVLRAKAA